MHNPDTDNAAHLPLGERWRRLKAAYRVCNLATHHVLGFTVKLALLLYFAFTITFLLLRYAVLPHIDYYKGSIERLAGRALGSQVSIARIYASWHGLQPSLFLGDVVLRDKQGRQVLSLPSVSATLSWWSVMTAQPRFASLEIIRPDLDVRRTADGQFYVAGMALQDQPGGGDPDWIFKQHQIVIREGKVHWTDQLRGAPELALENVNLVLLNRWHHHQFALRATPPASLSGPLDVRADFTHPTFADRISNAALWKGELYADLADTDLQAWKRYIDYPFQLDSGNGSVRAWLRLDRARLAGFTADVGLAGVSARLGRDLPQLDLARVRGRVSAFEPRAPGRREGKPAFGAFGHTITLTDFSLSTADGLSLRPTTVTEVYTAATAKAPERIDISARELDLETLAQLAEQLPLKPPQRALLADFAPRGKLSDVSASWQGRYPAIVSYQLRARLDGLGIKPQAARLAQPKTAASPATAALPALPGFANLSGTIDASEKGGTVSLDARQFVLHVPAWFADPSMPFDQFTMQARWSFLPADQVLLNLDALNLAQGKLKASLSGKHQIMLKAQPGHPAGVIDLNGTLSGFELDTIGRFLPLQTPDELRAWLTGALEAGTANDVSLRLRGDLAHFPFRADHPAERGRGEFRVAGKLENGRLNYAPGHLSADGKGPLWPQADKIKGSFVFDRTRMEIKGDTARTLNAALSNVKAVVADLSSPERTLEIDGNAAAPMQEFLHYVAASPVLGWIGHFTEDSRASGNAKLALKLRLPLTHMLDAKVLGTVTLAGNDVVLFPELPPIQAALGKIEFNEHGVNLNGVGASFLGGPLALTGGTQRDNSIAIKLAGTVAAEGLRRQYAALAMAPVVDKLSGAARYSGLITFKDRQLKIDIESALAGLGLDFPAPLSKAPDDSLPTRFSLTGTVGADGVSRDELKLSVGNNMAARYFRQKLPRQAWSVLRGGIGVNLPAPEPDSGLMVNVHLPTLNVDHWLAIGAAVAGARAGRRRQPGGRAARRDRHRPGPVRGAGRGGRARQRTAHRRTQARQCGGGRLAPEQ